MELTSTFHFPSGGLLNCCGWVCLAISHFFSLVAHRCHPCHVWVEGCGAGVPWRSPCRLYLSFLTPRPPLQWKACARAWKRDWWTWPCGWGPAPTTPEETHPLAGTQCPESSSRSCPSKESNHNPMVLVRVRPVWQRVISPSQMTGWDLLEKSKHHWWELECFFFSVLILC